MPLEPTAPMIGCRRARRRPRTHTRSRDRAPPRGSPLPATPAARVSPLFSRPHSGLCGCRHAPCRGASEDDGATPLAYIRALPRQTSGGEGSGRNAGPRGGSPPVRFVRSAPSHNVPALGRSVVPRIAGCGRVYGARCAVIRGGLEPTTAARGTGAMARSRGEAVGVIERPIARPEAILPSRPPHVSFPRQDWQHLTRRCCESRRKRRLAWRMSATGLGLSPVVVLNSVLPTLQSQLSRSVGTP